MGEFRRYGPQLPHDEAAQREHFKEVDEDLSHDQEADRIAKGSSMRPRWEVGYVVVLIGVAGFIVSCFLPYLSFGVTRSMSLYQLVVRAGFSQTFVQSIGGFLNLFGGPGIVAWIALAGIRYRGHASRWTPFALIAAAAVWSITWIGIFLSRSGFLGSYRLGFWTTLVTSLWSSSARSASGSLQDAPGRRRTRPLAPNRRRRCLSARPSARRAARTSDAPNWPGADRA